MRARERQTEKESTDHKSFGRLRLQDALADPHNVDDGATTRKNGFHGHPLPVCDAGIGLKSV